VLGQRRITVALAPNDCSGPYRTMEGCSGAGGMGLAGAPTSPWQRRGSKESAPNLTASLLLGDADTFPAVVDLDIGLAHEDQVGAALASIGGERDDAGQISPTMPFRGCNLFVRPRNMAAVGVTDFDAGCNRPR
jgi:hypothetical protein